MYHQTIVVGNLGRDPEMRYLPSGTPVCNFAVAVSEKWNDKQSGEKREKTTWYRVAVFGAQAESCAKFLAKGRQVMVIGTVEATAYMNQSGEAAASLELRAREVRFLSSGGNSEPRGQDSDDGGYEDYPDSGDIPF